MKCMKSYLGISSTRAIFCWSRKSVVKKAPPALVVVVIAMSFPNSNWKTLILRKMEIVTGNGQCSKKNYWLMNKASKDQWDCNSVMHIITELQKKHSRWTRLKVHCQLYLIKQHVRPTINISEADLEVGKKLLKSIASRKIVQLN